MGYTVLVTDHVFDSLAVERSILEPLGAEVRMVSDAQRQDLGEAVRGADGLLVCYANIDDAVVRSLAADGCRIIARYGIGYDNVDVAAAQALAITVTYVPDYCLEEVADHTLALMLAVCRDLPTAARAVRAGAWSIPKGKVHRLRGRRLALIGLGAIGRLVAARAAAFGLEVWAFDPYAADELPGITRVDSVRELVAEADIVSLHTPLTPETRHVIGEQAIAAMGRAPMIINTARGPLVDLDAIVAGLDAGAVGGVALDVTELEPLPADHPLRTHPAALITPHMAFYSVEAQEELQRRAAEEVARALRGQPPLCAVPPVLRAPA